MSNKSVGSSQFAVCSKRLPLNIILNLLFLLVALTACNSDFVQKERGYFKIAFPKKEYRVFNQPGFPYSFEYPAYGNIIQDSLFFDEKA